MDKRDSNSLEAFAALKEASHEELVKVLKRLDRSSDKTIKTLVFFGVLAIGLSIVAPDINNGQAMPLYIIMLGLLAPILIFYMFSKRDSLTDHAFQIYSKWALVKDAHFIKSLEIIKTVSVEDYQTIMSAHEKVVNGLAAEENENKTPDFVNDFYMSMQDMEHLPYFVEYYASDLKKTYGKAVCKRILVLFRTLAS